MEIPLLNKIEKNQDNSFLIDGLYKFSDLVEIPKLKELFESFSKITGFTVGLVDNHSLEVLISIGWRDICKNFHRPDPNANIHCKSSNKILFDDLNQPDQIHINKCENGLYDGETPIIIDGKHVANLSTGQLLFEKPNIQEFTQQARKYGFNESNYLEAVQKVLVTSEEHMREVMQYLAKMAKFIAEIGLNRLRSKRMEHELLQAQKLEAIGKLTGGIAHDFNNLLSVINNESDIIESKLNEYSVYLKEDLNVIKQTGHRGAELTHKLLNFSRNQTNKPIRTDINEIIQDQKIILERLIKPKLSLKFRLFEEPIQILIDPSHIAQIILNLVINASDAISDVGEIIIKTTKEIKSTSKSKNEIHSDEELNIIISDTGTGMSPEQLRHLFEPFYTTKPQGTGLGLSTVYGIVKQLNGQISVYSEVGKGTTFKIDLPLDNPFN